MKGLKMLINCVKKILLAIILLIALYKVTAYSQEADGLEQDTYACKAAYDDFSEISDEEESVSENESDMYTLDFRQDIMSEVALIEFTLSSDNYIKLFVSDEEDKQPYLLIDGDAGKGSHFVFFKSPEGSVSDILTCNLEVYSEEGVLLQSLEEDIEIFATGKLTTGR